MTDEENLSTLKASAKEFYEKHSTEPSFNCDYMNGMYAGASAIEKVMKMVYTHSQVVDECRKKSEDCEDRLESAANTGVASFYKGKKDAYDEFVKNSEKEYDNGVRVILKEDSKPQQEKAEECKSHWCTKKKYYAVESDGSVIGYYTVAEIYSRTDRKIKYDTFKVKRYEEDKSEVFLDGSKRVTIDWTSFYAKDSIPAEFRRAEEPKKANVKPVQLPLRGFRFIDEREATHIPEAHYPLVNLKTKSVKGLYTIREFYEALGSQTEGKLSMNSIKGYCLNKKKYYITNGKETYYLDFGNKKVY